MKQYTTYVHLKEENPFTQDTSPVVFTTVEAYQQAMSGQNINSIFDLQGVPTHVIIPRHAISHINIIPSDVEVEPPVDAFCAE